MIDLTGAQASLWIALEDDGPELFGRLADGLDEALAEDAGKKAIVAFAKNAELAEEYGFGAIDWSKPLGQDADAINIYDGLGRYLFAIELVMQCCTDWRGVTFTGKPAPFTRRNVALFLKARIHTESLHGFGRFGSTYSYLALDKLLTPLREAKKEGNG